jgi:hypothetical protein
MPSACAIFIPRHKVYRNKILGRAFEVGSEPALELARFCIFAWLPATRRMGGTMKKYFASHFRRALAFVVLFVCVALSAYAAQTAITVQTPVGPYPGVVSAGQLALTFTAGDATNGNSFPITGHEILIVYNSSSSTAGTFTISSVADQYGRTQDITAYSVAASSFAAFSFRGGTGGWKQSDGTVHLAVSASTMEFAVIYAQ